MQYTGTLVIPDGVTSIGDYAFYNCGFSGTLVLPESLESIGAYAFCGCNFSGDLLIPESVESIGESAFLNCYNFDGELTILGEETVIGEAAFYDGKWQDVYVSGKNVEWPYYSATIPRRVFRTSNSSYQNLTIHAQMNSTTRSWISDCNSQRGDKISLVIWGGRYDIEEWNISTQSLAMEIGESKTISLNIVPAVAAEQSIYWSSSNEKVATVKDGKVKAVGYGVAVVEANTSMGDSVTCTVSVLPFTDVNKKSWEYEGVSYVYGKNLMSGVSDTEFWPGTKLTRSQFVTVLHNYSGEPQVSYSSRFSDVEDGKWYTIPVLWAAENDITSGYGDSFGVNDEITREQLVTMLYSFADSKGLITENVTGDLSDYPDADKVQSWAEEAMLWAINNEIVSGKLDNKGRTIIDPAGEATRAECATIIMNFDMSLAEE